MDAAQTSNPHVILYNVVCEKINVKRGPGQPNTSQVPPTKEEIRAIFVEQNQKNLSNAKWWLLFMGIPAVLAFAMEHYGWTSVDTTAKIGGGVCLSIDSLYALFLIFIEPSMIETQSQILADIAAKQG